VGFWKYVFKKESMDKVITKVMNKIYEIGTFPAV
jgi:hypothetical protein